MNAPLTIMGLLAAPLAPRRLAVESPRAESFRQQFCTGTGCAADEFEAELFRHCLKKRARIFAWLTGGLALRVFAPDRALLAQIADARDYETVRDAIDDFWNDPVNDSWLRRVAHTRISTNRLRRLAARYLPARRPARGKAAFCWR